MFLSELNQIHIYEETRNPHKNSTFFKSKIDQIQEIGWKSSITNFERAELDKLHLC